MFEAVYFLFLSLFYSKNWKNLASPSHPELARRNRCIFARWLLGQAELGTWGYVTFVYNEKCHFCLLDWTNLTGGRFKKNCAWPRNRLFLYSEIGHESNFWIYEPQMPSFGGKLQRYVITHAFQRFWLTGHNWLKIKAPEWTVMLQSRGQRPFLACVTVYRLRNVTLEWCLQLNVNVKGIVQRMVLLLSLDEFILDTTHSLINSSFHQPVTQSSRLSFQQWNWHINGCVTLPQKAFGTTQPIYWGLGFIMLCRCWKGNM